MNMRMIGSMISAVALLLVAAAPADAQRTAQHEGYWISFGFGGGTAFGDDAWDGDSKFGGAGFLRMGGSPSQQLRLVLLVPEQLGRNVECIRPVARHPADARETDLFRQMCGLRLRAALLARLPACV